MSLKPATRLWPRATTLESYLKVSRLRLSTFGTNQTTVICLVFFVINLLICPDFFEVYDHSITAVNSYAGGPYQQAISGLSNLNNDWYDGKAYQTYAFDYTPGAKGHITWMVGDQPMWTIDSKALGPNGNVGQRVMPEEPMAIVLNFGMSDSFSSINLTGISTLLPATMRVDYIRIYQDDDNPIMTCDPPGYPTTSYIKNHPEPYANNNLTKW